MIENELSFKIRGVIFKVYNTLGPGLLESAYEAALLYELRKSGLEVKQQVGLPLIYDDVKLEVGYRIDLLVENEIIIEIKSCEAIAPIFTSQLITYLKLYNRKLGYLINFNVPLLKDGFKRIVNNF